MLHTREEVIQRVVREYTLLDELLSGLSDEEWALSLARPETKDPWTVKDALAHITYWKSNSVRVFRKQRKPPEERGLEVNPLNHLVYTRWRDRSPQEVLAWHRQVQEDALAVLREAPEELFSGRERSPQWPFDLDGHSAEHRLKDIRRALEGGNS